jgi:two-component system, chemotaxis family, chemotaxis protein CheY
VASTATKTVLIVDDNAFIRQALCELFKREADFEVCGEAENGKDAIKKAQDLCPDLIVLDLSMPVMNGFDAARVLKRLMPTVPLIMYSAFGDKLAEKQARLIGISEVVSKAEHAGVLIHKARGLLNSAAAGASGRAAQFL